MKSLARFLIMMSLGVATQLGQSSGADVLPGKILLIGDSHVQGTYGSELDRHLRTIPSAQVATYGVGGSTPRWYLEGVLSPWGFFYRNERGETQRGQNQPTPLFNDLLARHSPSLVVISLGTNLMWGEESSHLEKSVHTIVKRIYEAGASCIWIGPPGLGPQYRTSIQLISSRLAQVLSKLNCRWVDGQTLVEYPTGSGGDEIHYDSAGNEGVVRGRAWAQRAFEAIVSPTGISR